MRVRSVWVGWSEYLEDAQADESMALWASGFVSRRVFGSLCGLHKRLEGLVGGWMFGWNFRSRQSPAAPAYMLSTSWVEGGSGELSTG